MTADPAPTADIAGPLGTAFVAFARARPGLSATFGAVGADLERTCRFAAWWIGSGPSPLLRADGKWVVEAHFNRWSGTPVPSATPQQQAAKQVLAEAWEAFVMELRNGTLVATGFLPGSVSSRVAVAPDRWIDGLYVEFDKGIIREKRGGVYLLTGITVEQGGVPPSSAIPEPMTLPKASLPTDEPRMREPAATSVTRELSHRSTSADAGNLGEMKRKSAAGRKKGVGLYQALDERGLSLMAELCRDGRVTIARAAIDAAAQILDREFGEALNPSDHSSLSPGTLDDFKQRSINRWKDRFSNWLNERSSPGKSE